MHFYIIFFISSFFISSFNVIADTAKVESFRLPPNHTSHYRIEKAGIDVGDMDNQFYFKDELITYKSIAKAKGIAAHFINFDPIENSELYWPKNQRQLSPRQARYDYIRGNNHKKNQHIKFNWADDNQLTINGEYKHNHYQLQTMQTVWSRQLLPILMSSALQLKPTMTHNSFYIIDKGKINKYTYTLQNHEDITFNQEVLNTLQFKITQDGSNHETFVWLSAKHFYLPLKIEQFKGGALNMRLIMTQLSLTNYNTE